MGILNFVFGGLGALCGLCLASANALGFAVIGAQKNSAGANTPESIDYLDKNLPGWEAIEVGRCLMFIFLGVALIISGLGLLKMQPWARWLSLLCSAGILVTCLVYAVYQGAFVLPAMEKMHEQEERRLGTPAATAAMNKSARQAGGVIGILLSSGLPILYAIPLGVVMLLPSVSEAFARANRRKRKVDDEDDVYGRQRRSRIDDEDDDDRDGRRRRRGRAYDDRDDEDDNRFRRRPRGRDYDDYD
jgi:hypothetical protein